VTDTADRNGLPDYLTAEQIAALGLEPDELRRLGVESVTGHGGRECWPAEQVREWLGRQE
jgi:hypothetical protein